MKSFQKNLKNILQSVIDSGFGIGLIIDLLTNTKRATVYRFYWGRGGVYKQAFHISIFVLTIIVFITGLSNRVVVVGANSLQSFDANLGNIDLLQQGTSISSVLAVSPTTNFKIVEYRVADGDSLQSIADKYGVSKETIKWSNMDKYGDYVRYNEDKIFPGEVVRIPEVTGVLHDVKDGDTLQSIIDKTSGDRFTVIEVNRLDGPDYNISGRNVVLVPEGRLNPPPRPTFEQNYIISTRPRPQAGDCGVNGEINGVSLSTPLCHPACVGYNISQEYLHGVYGYEGLDLAKSGGCPISSICDGVVTTARWNGYDNGGYVTTIDCGKGVTTTYFHGDGNFWVSSGEAVSRGQPVMYMGCSGWCTGTHLHWILRDSGQIVHPGNYVGY